MENPKLKKAIQEATALAYQTQKERIQIANQITREYRRKNLLEKKEKKNTLYGLEEDPQTIKKLLEKKEENPLLTQYLEKREEEEQAFLSIQPLIEGTNIFQKYLFQFPEISIGVLGVLVGWFEIEKASYPSAFWSYAGLIPPKQKSQRKKEKISSLKEIPTEVAVKKSNPFIKAKIIGELGKILTQKTNKWHQTYKTSKEKISANPKKKIKSPSHLHNMATRIVIKEFLKELHINWRKAEGLPEPLPFKERQNQTKTHCSSPK